MNFGHSLAAIVKLVMDMDSLAVPKEASKRQALRHSGAILGAQPRLT